MVRAWTSARSLLRAIWDDVADAGTGRVAEPTDEWIDTEGVNGDGDCQTSHKCPEATRNNTL
jgi:hypothetical protein